MFKPMIEPEKPVRKKLKYELDINDFIHDEDIHISEFKTELLNYMLEHNFGRFKDKEIVLDLIKNGDFRLRSRYDYDDYSYCAIIEYDEPDDSLNERIEKYNKDLEKYNKFCEIHAEEIKTYNEMIELQKKLQKKPRKKKC